MTDFRADHGCAKIKRNGRDYLVAVGGHYGPTMTATNTIEFYDLTLMPSSWEFIPGITLNQPRQLVGWKITVFDVGKCEAFFLGVGGIGSICTGNYSWSNVAVNTFNWGALFYPVVDANLVGGDTVW